MGIMKMKISFVFLLGIGLVAAQRDYSSPDELLDEGSLYDQGTPSSGKKPCCLPDQWESSFRQSISFMTPPTRQKIRFLEQLQKYHISKYFDQQKSYRIAIMGSSSVDSLNQRASLIMKVIKNSQLQNLTIIINGPDMYVANTDKQRCQHVTLRQPMQNLCIGQDATNTGSVTLGYGNESLVVDSWRGKIQQYPILDLGYHVTVTPSMCIPVRETGGGTLGKVYMNFDATFVDFKTSIKDPSVFNVPSYCRNAEEYDESRLQPLTGFFAQRFIKLDSSS